MNTKSLFIPLLLVLVGILLLVFYIGGEETETSPEAPIETDAGTVNQDEETNPSIDISTPTAQGPDGEESQVVIQQIPISDDPTIELPNLNRSPTPGPAYSGQALDLITSRILEAQNAVKGDMTNFAKWLSLGNVYSIAQDYEGAKEVYEYLTIVNNNTSLPFHNLGTLNHYHLKNYPEAEKRYLEALERNDQSEQTYRDLSQLYLDAYKVGTGKAEETLLAGLEALPQSITLHTAIADYYEDSGDNAQAISYYTAARDLAEAEGNSSLVNSINNKLNNLSN